MNKDSPERTIVHMDLDSFFVSVERLLDSSLTGKPVIVGGHSGRGVVASCSYEARAMGVHSAMPMKQALALCPKAVVVCSGMGWYTHYSNLVTQIIAESAPAYEKASIDEFYMDFTGLDRFFGAVRLAKELRQRIMRETGLPISMGISINKTVAKIATGQAKPNGELYVPQVDVKAFLSPLPIQKIPGVGDKTFLILQSLGIATIHDLAKTSPDVLQRCLGIYGPLLWKKANGLDRPPLCTYWERKSIGAENTFEKDTANMVDVDELLVQMVEKIAFSMRKNQKLASCVTLKIRYADFETHTVQKHIGYTSFDHELIPVARELFVKTYNKRKLIRLVGVRLSGLITGAPQINLFNDTSKLLDLYQAVDRMRLRYGRKSVIRAVGVGMQEEEKLEFGYKSWGSREV